MKILYSLFVFLLLLPNYANATRIRGTEMRYEHISSLKYKIILVKYEDCIGPPSVHHNIKASCGVNTVVLPSGTSSSYEINQYCPDTSSLCNGGVLNGVKKVIQTVTIDFSESAYASIRNCGTIHLTSNVGTIRPNTTAPTSHQVYVDIDLDSHKQNSSPIFTRDPIVSLCCNQPANLSLGAYDLLDGDSLSFEWGQALNHTGDTISFPVSGIAYDHPFQVYYPSGSVMSAYPQATPPIGSYLNSSTGEIIFTPTNCNQKALAVVAVKEWRNDSNGVSILVGTSFRNMIFEVTTCPDNNNPVITAPEILSVCRGDSIVVIITTNDVVFVPPPPATSPAPDSVKIHWSESIPSASFTIIDSTALNQSGRFVWYPDSTVKLNRSYVFTVTATDNHCPRIGQTDKTVSITVRDRVIATINKQVVSCNSFNYKLNLDVACLEGSPLFKWQILDSIGQSISNTDAQINTADTLQQVNLSVNKSGLYIIKITLTNDSQSYSQILVDTLDLRNPLSVSLNQSDSILCFGDSISLHADVQNSKGVIDYFWRNTLNQVLNYYDTSIHAGLTRSHPDKTYYLTVFDDTHCYAIDSVRIYNNLASPLLIDTAICQGETVSYSVNANQNNVLWNNVISTDSISISTSGNVFLSYSDSVGCTYKDTAFVSTLSIPISSLNDTAICATEYTLSVDSVKTILWSNSNSTTQIVVTSSGAYSVYLKDSNGCETYDTATIDLKYFEAPKLPNDTTSCEDNISLDPGSSYDTYVWSTGETSNTIEVSQSNKYSVTVSTENGCSMFDSIQVSLFKNLKVPTLIRQNGRIESNQSGEHKWFKDGVLLSGNNANYLVTSLEGAYTSLTIDSNGCESDTSSPVTITLGINTLEEHSISIYPNPSNGSVIIQLQGLNTDIVKGITLMDAHGRLVKTSYIKNENNFTLEWNPVSAFYWLIIDTEKGVYRQKITSLK